MNEIKRGQKVWVLLNDVVKETTVKSVGPKYITVEAIDLLFDRRTLRKMNSHSYAYLIITDLKKYEEEQYRKGLIDKIKNFKWELLDKEELEKFVDILNEY